ncbi:hypothetical protein [Photobacterium nomapromontoriensis]|uniref:hypothetical protein n=1 Tax=Photobacterium nomapromontoriensis TaxID=2910237 RepID=UPI003D0D06FA
MKYAIILLLAATFSSLVMSNDANHYNFKETTTCKETGDNPNQAAVTSTCGNIGRYSVELAQVLPDIQVISLLRKDIKILSWFHTVTKELPFILDFPIYWLVEQNEPRYLLTKLNIGSEEANFDYQPHLVVSRVQKDKICPILTLSTLDINEAKQYMLEKAETQLAQLPCLKPVNEQ